MELIQVNKFVLIKTHAKQSHRAGDECKTLGQDYYVYTFFHIHFPLIPCTKTFTNNKY